MTVQLPTLSSSTTCSLVLGRFRPMKLGEILLRKQLVSPQELEKVLAAQQLYSQKLGEILLDLGILSEEDLKISLKEQLWRQKGFWIID